MQRLELNFVLTGSPSKNRTNHDEKKRVEQARGVSDHRKQREDYAHRHEHDPQ